MIAQKALTRRVGRTWTIVLGCALALVGATISAGPASATVTDCVATPAASGCVQGTSQAWTDEVTVGNDSTVTVNHLFTPNLGAGITVQGLRWSSTWAMADGVDIGCGTGITGVGAADTWWGWTSNGGAWATADTIGSPDGGTCNGTMTVTWIGITDATATPTPTPDPTATPTPTPTPDPTATPTPTPTPDPTVTPTPTPTPDPTATPTPTVVVLSSEQFGFVQAGFALLVFVGVASMIAGWSHRG